MTNFTDLGLSPALLKTLAAEGYETPTPIQTQAIPAALAGQDLLGIAQTGTGKTAAFALPILQRLAADRTRPLRKSCRTLVLSPTRELANQIADSFRTYGRNLGLSVAVVYGGVGQGPQVRTMAQGVDVLVATPGRLLDLIGQRVLHLGSVEVLVLDEADQMLDLGFLVPIRRIVALLPAKRQSLFFSATMPKEIGKLAGELLTDPIKVSVAPTATTVERVEQQVILVEASRKRTILAELLADPAFQRTLVFTRTKRGADRVARHLVQSGIPADAIHGDKSQGQRERALGAFRAGRLRILVATDIAARGIDVDGVTHVVNFELPNVPESYVHRIGRTARAGAAGIAISLCDEDERGLLRDIERLTRLTLPRTDRRSGEARVVSASAVPAGRPAQHRQGHGQGHGHGHARPGQGHGRPAQGRPGGSNGRPQQPSRGRSQHEQGARSEERAPRQDAKRSGQDTRRPQSAHHDGELSRLSFMAAPRDRS